MTGVVVKLVVVFPAFEISGKRGRKGSEAKPEGISDEKVWYIPLQLQLSSLTQR